MNVPVFGETLLPICNNYVLPRTARDHEQKYGKEVADTLRGNFYVDDLLKSFQDEQKAIKLIKDITAMCAKGGFWISKFVNNRKDVLLSIPESEKRKSLEDQEPRLGTLPTEKALGIHWNIEEDKLGFEVNVKDNPHTKCGMLSTVCSIYDPLGLVFPILLKRRKIIQMFCLKQRACDDALDEDILKKWIKWKLSLKHLQRMKLHRCYKPNRFRKVVSCSLYYFSGASESGYRQATYLRLVNLIGKVYWSLVIAKSQVAPMKYTSTPR